MKQQTAMSKLYSYIQVTHDLGGKIINTFTLLKLINEFKELEKNQIIRAYIDGYIDGERYDETPAEDYYNQKYIK